MAENTADNLPALSDDYSQRPRSGSNLLEGFYSLNILRQLGLMIGLAASVAIGFAVVLWAQGGNYKPLYSNVQNIDATKVIQVLDSYQIPYKLDEKTGALLVASDQLYTARLKLADAGMPGDRSAGFELLDQEQPLGTSQFMENARYRRSLEGELARTIRSINVVRSARVHIAMPKRTVFLRDSRKPSASVLVDLLPGTNLKNQQVKAIANLVAASIPELSLEDVTVVDQKGNLLSKADENEEIHEADRQFQYARRVESNLMARIGDLLNPIVGEGKFRTQVAADVDFTQVEQTDEVYNPDLPAVRSEQTMEERRVGGSSVGGIPGALSNQPPGQTTVPEQTAAAGAGGTAQQAENATNSRRQSTRNYELDRTLSYTRHHVGDIKRLSVAVVVDDFETPAPVSDAEGEANTEQAAPQRRPWTEDELARLTILIKDAVGFNAARGDSVNVINSPFVIRVEEEEKLPEPQWYEHPLVRQLAPYLAVALVFLILVFAVVRPVLRNLSSSAKEIQAQEAQHALAAAGGGMGGSGGLGDETVTLSGGDSMLLPRPDQSYEEHLNAIKGLIAEDPGRVAQVVKRWIAQSE